MAQAHELRLEGRSGRGLIVLALAGLVAVALSGASPAAAAAPSCRDAGGSRTAPVTVRIDTPDGGERLRGGTVQVKGTAHSAAPLSRIELVRAGSVLASQEVAPSPTVAFTLRWDTARGPVGRTAVRVLACGPSAHGESFVEVDVPSRRPLWVGLVMGLAGLGGLAYAFRPWVRPAEAHRPSRPRPGGSGPTLTGAG